MAGNCIPPKIVDVIIYICPAITLLSFLVVLQWAIALLTCTDRVYIYIHIYTERDRQTDGQTDRDRETEREGGERGERETETDRQRQRQRQRQTERQRERGRDHFLLGNCDIYIYMRCHHNMVNFLPNHHKRYSISRSWDMGCILWPRLNYLCPASVIAVLCNALNSIK